MINDTITQAQPLMPSNAPPIQQAIRAFCDNQSGKQHHLKAIAHDGVHMALLLWNHSIFGWRQRQCHADFNHYVIEVLDKLRIEHDVEHLLTPIAQQIWDNSCQNGLLRQHLNFDYLYYHLEILYRALGAKPSAVTPYMHQYVDRITNRWVDSNKRTRANDFSLFFGTKTKGTGSHILMWRLPASA